MIWILILIAAAAGAANPFQSGANAELNRSLGHPAAAALWVYASGLAAVLAAAVVLRLAAPHLAHGAFSAVFSRAVGAPWWAWLGGVASVAPTLAGLMLAQRLGSGVFTTASVAAGVVMSVLLDQFGWIGFRQHSASPGRILGCCLLVTGVWLVARF